MYRNKKGERKNNGPREDQEVEQNDGRPQQITNVCAR